MSLFDHLAELRNRLFKASLSLVIAFSLTATVLYDPVFSILTKPYCNLPADLRGGTGQGDCTLITLGVAEPFLLRLRISLICAVLLAAPFWLYQLWAFITPGLHAKEKRFAVPFVLTSTFLFGLGSLFAYLTLDRGLNFLLGFGGEQLTTLLQADRYLNYVIFVLIAFGVSFQFPLLLVFLELVGVVDDIKLRRWRRGMIFGIAVFTAVITPSQDPFTFFAMAAPMYAFYEIVVVYARFRGRARRRRAVDAPQWDDDETSPIDA